MYNVTIAIALFNAEKYIKKTLTSALNQTFNYIEYLIINDCSYDDSINIINEIKINHPRGKHIRIVNHTKNMGIGVARNTAINEAKGEYLFYLDSDDLIKPNCIEILYNSAFNHDAEIVISSYEKTNEIGIRELEVSFPTKVINESDGILKYRYQSTKQIMEFYVWNILFKTSFLRKNNLFFSPVRIGEDVIFTLNMNSLVHKCILLPDVTYTYIKRPNSLSQFNKRSHINLDEVVEQLYYRRCKKTKCIENKSKSFAANEVTHVMKDCFYAALSVLQKEKLISPPLSEKDVKSLLTHPLTFIEIIHLKQNKVINIIFYLLGKLPYIISKFIILFSFSTVKIIQNLFTVSLHTKLKK